MYIRQISLLAINAPEEFKIMYLIIFYNTNVGETRGGGTEIPLWNQGHCP